MTPPTHDLLDKFRSLEKAGKSESTRILEKRRTMTLSWSLGLVFGIVALLGLVSTKHITIERLLKRDIMQESIQESNTESTAEQGSSMAFEPTRVRFLLARLTKL
jgi:hypothetical protein